LLLKLFTTALELEIEWADFILFIHFYIFF
jgi:hypothetical protein